MIFEDVKYKIYIKVENMKDKQLAVVYKTHTKKGANDPYSNHM